MNKLSLLRNISEDFQGDYEYPLITQQPATRGVIHRKPTDTRNVKSVKNIVFYLKRRTFTKVSHMKPSPSKSHYLQFFKMFVLKPWPKSPSLELGDEHFRAYLHRARLSCHRLFRLSCHRSGMHRNAEPFWVVWCAVSARKLKRYTR